MIEPTIGMVDAFFDALPGLRATPDVRADVRAGLAAVLALVEREYRLTCRETVELDGLVVHCTRAPDGHGAHRGHDNAGGVFW